MQGPLLTVSAGQDGAPIAGRRRDLGLVLVLLLLAVGLRAWAIAHTEVVARDGIVFIDYALQFEHKHWKNVLRDNHQHPGYPLSVLAVSFPLRQYFGGTDCGTMQWSAQLASSLAGVLLVIPMFFLGKTLFDRGVGFWGTLLFQCLPVSGRVLADGLSEALFLLFLATALLLAVRGLRSGTLLRFVLCGLCCGLAYLTRPEGAVLVAALVLFLFLMQLVPAWRRGWHWTLTRGASVAVVALAVASPYLIVTQRFTNKLSGGKIVKLAHAGELCPDSAPSEQRTWQHGPPSRNGGFSSGSSPTLLAVWLNRELSFSDRLWIGLRAVVAELVKGFHYFAWLPALLGLWWYRRLAARPEAWLILVMAVIHTLVLWRLAMVAGYVSERHVLVLVLCGVFPAAAGLRDLPSRLLQWRLPLRDAVATGWRARQLAWAPVWSVVLLLVAVSAGLPKTLPPLHANRAGHHAAGIWLAQNARPVDEVCDGHFGWASYYAGRFCLDPNKPIPPAADHCRFVVKGNSNAVRNPYGPTAAEADMTLAEIRAAGGEIVYYWPSQKPPDQAQVTVWKIKVAVPKTLPTNAVVSQPVSKH